MQPSESGSLPSARWPLDSGMRATIASDASMETALEPVKLFECIGKGNCDVGSRFAVQCFGLD